MKNYESILGSVQNSWEQVVKDTNLERLNLPPEFVAILRLYYSIAHNEGQESMMDVMRDIYDNDIDLFESFFEPNTDILQ